MRWLQTEYICKGIFLGLLLYAALHEPDWPTLGWVNLCILAGLVLGLGVAAVRKFSQGYRVGGRALAFVLFLLLESPAPVYAGILAGTAVGVAVFIPAAVQPVPTSDTAPEAPADTAQPPAPAPQPPWRELVFFGLGGAVLGSLFGSLRRVQRRPVRIGLSLALAAVLVAGALALSGQLEKLGVTLPFEWLKPRFVLEGGRQAIFAVQLLIGIPVFYVLTFAGREEESEVEIGAMCAALGLGLWMLASDTTLLPRDLPALRTAGFLVPIAIYFFYSTRVLPGLRVFKHALRGLSYLQMGQFRLSLLSLRRALQLDPRNRLARETLWAVHRSIDFEHLPDDPELLSLIDLDLCLDRAAALLLNPGPTQGQLAEAHRLLDLVVKQRPAMAPRVQYWRAVAFTHARAFDRAAAELQQVLDPATYGPDDPQRRVVLLQAWQLALTLHDELRRRVGLPQLAHPGRRMEAVTAVERHLAAHPDDRSIWNLKQLLYQDLCEAEYIDAAGGADLVAPHFDHAYAQQLGLALINDPVRWQRGGEYLRIAARGMPSAGTSLFITIAQANQRAGNQQGAWHNYELAKRAGQSVGSKNLPDEERQAYFNTVKLLAEHALSRGDTDAAIENLRLYTESERSGVETLRTLADLYERKGDPLPALRATEQALAYNARDKDLVARKDRYYYSVMPQDLRARLDSVRGCFDVNYCLRKGRSLLDAKNADLEVLDWAQHLVELARVVQPESVTARVLLARCRLRRGETDGAVALLEELRNPKPERFVTEDDEDAWYLSCRLLGDLYLNTLGRPELAVACYTDFRKSSKSGADTAFKLGRAYEQIGDLARAKRFYEQVTTYDNHPLVYEARDALHRLATQ
jgi:tetratricopeptide (TPR) repeat protein